MEFEGRNASAQGDAVSKTAVQEAATQLFQFEALGSAGKQSESKTNPESCPLFRQFSENGSKLKPAVDTNNAPLTKREIESISKTMNKAECQWNEYLKKHPEISEKDAQAAFKLESAVIKGDASEIQKVAGSYKDDVAKLKEVANLAKTQLEAMNSQAEINFPEKDKAVILVHQHLNEGEEGLALKVYGKQYESSAGKAPPLVAVTSLFKICGGETFETIASYTKPTTNEQFMRDFSKQVRDDINWKY